jgi:hypothetical protein
LINYGDVAEHDPFNYEYLVSWYYFSDKDAGEKVYGDYIFSNFDDAKRHAEHLQKLNKKFSGITLYRRPKVDPPPWEVTFF